MCCQIAGKEWESSVKSAFKVLASSAALLWANTAFAACGLPWTAPCSGGGTAVPEMDGSASIMAIALVAGVAALIYNRGRK